MSITSAISFVSLVISMGCALVPLRGIAATKTAEDAPASPATGAEAEFGLAAAQVLADARRCELYGACGACIFKERIGRAWVFRTSVGYGGAPAPDITVLPPGRAGPSSASPAAVLTDFTLPSLRVEADIETIRPLNPTLAERTEYWRHALILVDTVADSSLRVVFGHTMKFGGPGIFCVRASRDGKVVHELFYSAAEAEIPRVQEKNGCVVLRMPSGFVLLEIERTPPAPHLNAIRP